MPIKEHILSFQDEDSKIWREFKYGNKQAFSYLFHTYSDTLYKYGLTIVHDKELVKDCIQELFCNLWRSRQNLDNVVSVKYYLIKSIRRIIIRNQTVFRKKFQSKTLFEAFTSEKAILSPESTLIREQSLNEQNQYLLQAIESLPKRQKEAIYLRFYQEMDYDQITAIMELNYQGVRNLIYKAVKNLRSNLKHHSIPYPFISLLLAALLHSI